METEIKLRMESAEAALSMLLKAGFQISKPRVFEENLILDDDSGSIKASGKLLRVRRAGAVFTCTWKGPGEPGPHKSREEREFTVSDFDECLAVFKGLGLTQRFRYDKHRTELARDTEPGHVTLDETPIGTYLELEGEAAWIDRTAAELGYKNIDFITESYARMYETL